MRTGCIAFAAGAWWLQRQEMLPDPRVLLAALAALLSAAVVLRRSPWRSHAIARSVLVATTLAVAGFGWAAWRADVRLADALLPALEMRDLVVVGTIASLPVTMPGSLRFTFAVESARSLPDGGPVTVPRRIALAWFAPRDGSAARPTIRPGQRWRFPVRLKRPHGTANPHGFDYEYWLLDDGVRATGTVRESGRLLAEFVATPGHAVDRARSILRDRVVRALSNADGTVAPYAGVIVALVVGDQRAIAQSDWDVFNRTGIGHLISISGLHVSMLAALGGWLVFQLWRRHPRWCVRLPAQKAAAAAGVGVALAYCLLAGFGVPAQRTLYMIAVVALALWTDRAGTISRVLCVALFVVTALDPWAVTGAGFWLSFSAVAAIFYVTTGRIAIARRPTRLQRARAALRTALRVQWAVTLALVPLTLALFQQVSVVSPLANAIAIPLVGLVVTPLSLAGSVLPGLPGAALLQLAHGAVATLAVWLKWLSATPVAVWTGPAPSPWAFAAAMLGVVWWLAPVGVPSRWIGLLWLAPLFAWPADRPAPGAVRVTALDVGQGSAVFVETHDTTLLYDTGPLFGPESDAGGRIVVPYLRARGVRRLDRLVVSHGDADHAGGALSVMRAVPVGALSSSLDDDSPIVRAAPRASRCADGQRWAVDGVLLEFLHPLPETLRQPGGKPNARSCVLRIATAGARMLLTGDIEKADEAALVARAPERLRSDVLLVPHHGSRTSSTAAFIDAVGPAHAVVQAGYLNRFGHPRDDVVARYRERGIVLHRTDRDGAVIVTLTDAGVTVERHRDTHRRYWHGR